MGLMKPMGPTQGGLYRHSGESGFHSGYKRKSVQAMKLEVEIQKRRMLSVLWRKNRSNGTGMHRRTMSTLILLEFQVQGVVEMRLKRQVMKDLESQAEFETLHRRAREFTEGLHVKKGHEQRKVLGLDPKVQEGWLRVDADTSPSKAEKGGA